MQCVTTAKFAKILKICPSDMLQKFSLFVCFQISKFFLKKEFYLYQLYSYFISAYSKLHQILIICWGIAEVYSVLIKKHKTCYNITKNFRCDHTIAVLNNFSKFARKHLQWSFRKAADL